MYTPYNCPYFNRLRIGLFESHSLNVEELFSKVKHIRGTTLRIIRFFKKKQVFNRTPKISKRDLSLNRIIISGRNKRKNNMNKNTNTNKRSRLNK